MEIILLQLNDPRSIFFRLLGAHKLAWYLRQFNYTVQVINITSHFTINEIQTLIKKFYTDDTRIIGLGGIVGNLDDHTNFNGLVNLFKELKSNDPKINLVVGGSVSHVFKAKFKKNVDYYFEGHAENTFKSFADWVMRDGPRPTINLDKFGFKVIQELAFTGEHLFKIENCKFRWHDSDGIQQGESLPLETSRGCIFKCKFCQFPLIGKKKNDFLKPMESIREELIDNYEKFKTTNYYILDDTWNTDPARLEEFHRMVTSLPFKIKYASYLRLDLIHAHRHTEDLLIESGMKAPFFGIESFNEKAARFIGKGFSGERAKDYLLYLLKDKWGGNVFEQLSFIAGLPYTTKDDVRETVNWCLKNKIHSYIYPPLYLNKDQEGYFTSEFERNASSHGFTWDEGTGDHRRNWYHESGVNYKLATEWASLARNQSFAKHGAWLALQLYQYGYTDEEIHRLTLLEAQNEPHHKQRILNFVNAYKQTLLNM